jgi:transcriptional regulator GlxA family with amidase domain
MLLKPGKYYFGIVRKIMTLAEIIQDPASDAQINASIFLQQILMELHNQAKFDQQFASPIEQLLKLIKSRPEHWWTVRELAETCNISDDQLRRNFIQYSGVLPKQYIEEFKLRRAAEMLISCPLTVTKIANSFGYMDAYHFSRRFKLLFGISPEIYRKRFNLAN